MTSNISKALEARRMKLASGAKLTHKTIMDKWEEDKLSLRKSINAKCFDCSCHQIEEIRHCTAKGCPLWYVRPYQEK